MTKIDEGYIKFDFDWNRKDFEFNDQDFQTLNSYRQKLYNLGLIGAYPDGVGFGNLSIRYHENEFVISGSATGNLKILLKEHFALVKEFDIEKNNVQCVGLLEASSESLSHGAIYISNDKVNAIIHIHHRALWEKYLTILPTTNINAEFGTPEIALEIQKLTKESEGILIMGGHPEGIITYGKNLEEAYEILIKYYNNI